MAQPRTLVDKIWDSHVVDVLDDGLNILYIDRQLLHEVLSPQAFEGLRMAGRTVRRTDANLDYNYNDNPQLTAAIKQGYRGAYWDILRRVSEGIPPLSL